MRLLAVLLVAATGCGPEITGADDLSGRRDSAPAADATAARDLGSGADGATPDLGSRSDGALPPDASTPDLSVPDLSMPDLAPGVDLISSVDLAGTDIVLTCAQFANNAPVVPIVAVPEDAPVAVGGTIADGTYWVTKASLYTGVGGASGPTGDTLSEAVVFAGSSLQAVLVASNSPEERVSGAFAVNGAILNASFTCPRQSFLVEGFDATPTQLTVYPTIGGRPASMILTRQ